MSDHWEFYFCKIDDKVASVFLDVGIRESIPDSSRPWMIWVDVRLNHPRDDGLPGNEDFEPLKAIESVLKDAIVESNGGCLVGRISTDGRRTFYWYGSSPDNVETIAGRAMDQFPGYAWEAGTDFDPDWNQYLSGLYPSPREWRRIKNLHVVEQLEKHGDELRKSRPVTHWIYFDSETGRTNFKASVADKRFSIKIEKSTDGRDGSKVHGIVLERIDFVDWDSINAVTLELTELAELHGGDYDGWETPVVKTAAPSDD